MRYLIFAFSLWVCGCKGDTSNFVSPPLPDNLKKEPPYDFSDTRYPRDLSVGENDGDMAVVVGDHDMAMTIIKDLVKIQDLVEPRDTQ